MTDILIIKFIFCEMRNKENGERPISPCLKKRVRICSLNTQNRKILTECSIDLNANHMPVQSCASPKIINLHKKKIPTQSQNQGDAEMTQKDRRSRNSRSIKTEAIQKKNQTTEQFDKLFQITSRCVDYYHKFIEQKDAQLRIVKQAFAQIHQSLNAAFNGIINEVRTKHNQIKQFLDKKEKELIKIKDMQQLELNTTLNDVRSVHLSNLLRDYKNGDQSTDLGQQLGNYANTLHKFYQSMEKVEKCNFKEGVDETISFINNIITEEIKFIVYEKIPSKSLNGSFSFNDGLGFGNSISNSKAVVPVCYDTSGEHTILSQNIQQMVSERFLSKKCQTSQAWTQTISENLGQKQSLLEILNEINKKQEIMKEKLDNYRQLKL